jgi:hypothetical protein
MQVSLPAVGRCVRCVNVHCILSGRHRIGAQPCILPTQLGYLDVCVLFVHGMFPRSRPGLDCRPCARGTMANPRTLSSPQAGSGCGRPQALHRCATDGRVQCRRPWPCCCPSRPLPAKRSLVFVGASKNTCVIGLSPNGADLAQAAGWVTFAKATVCTQPRIMPCHAMHNANL